MNQGKRQFTQITLSGTEIEQMMRKEGRKGEHILYLLKHLGRTKTLERMETNQQSVTLTFIIILMHYKWYNFITTIELSTFF